MNSRRTGVRAAALPVLLLILVTSCRDDFFDPTPGGTGPTGAPTVELVAENLRLLAGDDNATRIGFSPRDPAARIRIERSADGGRIAACPLARIDDPLPDPGACLPDVPDGVRESITSTGLGAVALVRFGDPITVGLRVEFEEAGRQLAFRLPIIEVPAGASECKDNSCNPFFEILPVRGGTFTATARLTGGNGRLELLEGRVLARSLTSTGIPYRVAATSAGPPPLSIRATMNAPGEYALALSNTSSDDLRSIAIDAAWP
jgi:hypothetical protein